MHCTQSDTRHYRTRQKFSLIGQLYHPSPLIGRGLQLAFGSVGAGANETLGQQQTIVIQLWLSYSSLEISVSKNSALLICFKQIKQPGPWLSVQL